MSNNNIEINEFKIVLDDKEYTFRLDFRALIKFNKKYKGAMNIFNDFLANKNIYDCIVKILTCSCPEKEFDEDELASMLSFDFKTMKLMDDITVALIEGTLNDKKEGNQEKK